MNIYILDDNPETMLELAGDIKKYFPDYKTLCFDNYQQLTKELRTNHNCIVFLDVVMPTISGISLTNVIHNINENIPVILYSGENKDSFDVYDCFHLYFIEKPFTKEKLSKALEKAIAYLEKNYFTYSFAKIKNILPISTICYFESCGRAIRMVTKIDTKIFYEKLDSVEARLPINFVRASKSFLINPLFIKGVENNKIKLIDIPNDEAEKEINISKSCLKKVLEHQIFN